MILFCTTVTKSCNAPSGAKCALCKGSLAEGEAAAHDTRLDIYAHVECAVRAVGHNTAAHQASHDLMEAFMQAADDFTEAHPRLNPLHLLVQSAEMYVRVVRHIAKGAGVSKDDLFFIQKDVSGCAEAFYKRSASKLPAGRTMEDLAEADVTNAPLPKVKEPQDKPELKMHLMVGTPDGIEELDVDQDVAKRNVLGDLFAQSRFGFGNNTTEEV